MPIAPDYPAVGGYRFDFETSLEVTGQLSIGTSSDEDAPKFRLVPSFQHADIFD